MTQQGTILGTFQYMAPEQIEGLDADARTDLFAFGALLFEMLTGRHGVRGQDAREPARRDSERRAPARIHRAAGRAPALDRVIATCLAKDPDERYQSARDLLRDLRWTTSGETNPPVVQPSARPRSSAAPWLIAGALAIALLAAGTVAVRHVRESTTPADPVLFTIPAPEHTTFGGPAGGGTGVATQLAVSPDGRQVVFVANSQSGSRMWLRPVGAVDSTPILGTEDGAFPFWSPDSRTIAFFAAGQLKKVQVAGGPAIVLCDAGRGLGGTWNRDNVILFGLTPDSGGKGLMRVSAAGGVPVVASVLDATTGETSHRWPHFLPDGRHFLYTAATGTCCPAVKPAVIRIGTLDSTESVTLFEAESSVAFASGHLLFSRGGTLMAERFDPVARRVVGEPFPVADHIASEGTRYASFTAADNGLLVYARGGARLPTRLTWFDRAGHITGTVGAPGSYLMLTLSHDGRHVAVSLPSGPAENRAIWILDTLRGGMSRLTFDAVDDTAPVWSPDSSHLVFHSVRIGRSGMRLRAFSGTDSDDELLTGAQTLPSDWSRDGRYIAYSATASSTDVWILPMTGDRKPFALARTPFTERNAAFAPDGRSIAYQSNETGQPQVYFQPFPPTGRKVLVSINGGEQPMWRGDGKELFFIAPDSTMMATAIDTTHGFETGAPQPLFATGVSTVSGARQYGVSEDGKRFLVNARTERSTAAPLTAVLNWLAAVQK